MRISIRLCAVLAALVFSGSGRVLAVDKVSLTDLANHAVRQSRLIGSEGKPFYLKAAITETTNPESDFKGEIEEYWISPQKWRRTISVPGFSQTLIVNGDKISESDTGEYYPFWLHDLVTAIFDPLPMFGEKNETRRFQLQVEKPMPGNNQATCADFQSTTGVAPAQNHLIEEFCFEGNYGLIASVMVPGFEAQYKHHKLFGKKWIARSVLLDPDPGTTIEAKILELSELSSREDSEKLFVIERPTPETEQLKSVTLTEADLRKLLTKSPDVVWPAIETGKTSGVLSVYVSVDRDGKVHEAWPLRSDNTELDDSVREQVKQWEFKPAMSNGARVQVEGALTFSFQVTEKAASSSTTPQQ